MLLCKCWSPLNAVLCVSVPISPCGSQHNLTHTVSRCMLACVSFHLTFTLLDLLENKLGSMEVDLPRSRELMDNLTDRQQCVHTSTVCREPWRCPWSLQYKDSSVSPMHIHCKPSLKKAAQRWNYIELPKLKTEDGLDVTPWFELFVWAIPMLAQQDTI